MIAAGISVEEGDDELAAAKVRAGRQFFDVDGRISHNPFSRDRLGAGDFLDLIDRLGEVIGDLHLACAALETLRNSSDDRVLHGGTWSIYRAAEWIDEIRDRLQELHAEELTEKLAPHNDTQHTLNPLMKSRQGGR